MDALALARWQFAITTVYHFLFVPITIGLSAVVAGYHTAWIRTRNPQHLRMAKFLGKLFTINFALGLVTGIVQEFQFGMNWSDYSRFVGDIFGAPLAVEALLAFFLESTFLGLWIFGWGKLPERLHAATIWLVHIGTVLSAYFILAANSFMQHPVGFRYNPRTQRAELTDFFAVLTNKVQLVTFPHVVLSAYMVGGAFAMGVALWLMRRQRQRDPQDEDASMYRRTARLGAVLTLVASVGVVVSGDIQGKIMTEVQPMKMAAAEALYENEGSCAGFSLLTIGSLDGTKEEFAVKVPCLLSFLATGSTSGSVEGINPLRQQLKSQYGQGNALTADATYTPNIPLSYWSFRLMMGAGFVAMAAAAAVLWATRRGRMPVGRFWVWVAALTPLLPVFANSFGWIFTEVGRQPWIVYSLMTTSVGVSPAVAAGEVLTSMVVFTLLYGALAVVEVKLMLTYIRRGADPFEEPTAPTDEDAPLAFAY
jgi:cytochrome bd ubiquinol oxidase subunit I